MKELKQMLWMMLGVLVGLAIAGYALMWIVALWPQLGDNQSLSLLVAVPILGGGLAGGGYLAQKLVERYEKGKKRKAKVKAEAEPLAARKGKKKRK
jgi:Tfp pilus assembly protein PilN